MTKRVLSWLLAAALVLCLVPVPAGATEGARVVCGSAQAQPGQYFSLSINAEALENLASVDLEIYYDSDALTFQSYSTGYLLDGSLVSVSTAQPGSIRLSAAGTEAISGSGTLLWLHFTAAEDCTPGTYPLTLAVGEAYDSGLNPVSIAAQSGSVTVSSTPPVHGTYQLELYASQTTLAPGEQLTLDLKNPDWQSIASCDLTLNYDAGLFRLVSVSLPESMTQSGAVYSINDSISGLIRLSWACPNETVCYDLMTVTLEALDAAGSTRFTASSSDVYDGNRVPYQPGSASLDVTVQPEEPTPAAPRLYLDTETLVIGQESASLLKLEAGSSVAAADFVLEYDPELLTCVNVESAVTEGMVVINPNYASGAIRFSFVDEDGADAETDLVRITWRPAASADRHYTVSTSGIQVVDSEYQPVTLEYAADSGCIHTLETIDATCEEPGGEAWVCVWCGSKIYLSTTAPLGHLYGEPVFQWATDYSACTAVRTCARDGSHKEAVNCTVTHVSSGESCTEPGSITYTAEATFDGTSYSDTVTVTLDVLGHDYEWETITEPTCTEDGQRRGTCIRCGDTVHETLPALGHDWQGLECSRCGEIRENPFTDVPEKSFCYLPVMWAVENNITNGLTATTFGPNEVCTRAQVVTFLWRAAGSPEPTSTGHNFVDVSEKAFYYKAMLWAVESGITNGLTSTTFGPNAVCTRAQVVTFLWRTKGSPAPTSTEHPFADVSARGFYYRAMLWAVENGITKGLTKTTFGPNANCNRGQVVTFLYRAFN